MRTLQKPNDKAVHHYAKNKNKNCVAL